MRQVIRLILFLLVVNMQGYAQNRQTCVDAILQIEDEQRKVVSNEEDVLFVHYTVNTTDWENQVVNSEVKVYKGKEHMHFFSDQATIYQDKNNVFMILPMQKIVIISNTKKEVYNQRLSNDFYELKREFMDSCEVVKCDSLQKDPNQRRLELKVRDDMGGSIQIDRMIYDYNLQAKKIERVKFIYKKEYKVKQILITFKETLKKDEYKFAPSHKYVLDRNNKLLEKYKGYELIDNRENKK